MTQDAQVTAQPFVKWIGSKRRQIDRLLPHVPAGVPYVEPFLGGGALYFAAAVRAGAPVPGARLSDVNPRVVRAFQAVRDHVDEVIVALRRHAQLNCKAHYQTVVRTIPENLDIVEAAAWLIYLTKTAFNGLYRVNSSGQFNAAWGKYENPSICDEPTLRACSAVLQGVVVQEQDFRAALMEVPSGAFIYLDPPFWPAEGNRNFTQYTAARFGPLDHQTLAGYAVELRREGCTVLLSNSDVSDVRALYPEPLWTHTQLRVSRLVSRTMEGRIPTGELLLFGGPL